MPAPTLVASCTKACIKNIRSLTDVGDIEYWSLRTVLQRIDSPEQLHQIELRSPQIKGEDAELWHNFIARDIPNWQAKNYHPKNPTKWYEVYCKYKKEQRREVERDEAVLKASLAELNKKKATNVSKIVELKTLPKLPKDPRMLANNGGVPIGRNKGFVKPGASTLSWTSGSKTKLTDGQSVLTRARREAKEMSQRNKLAKPTHQLSGRVGQVKKAPAGMVDEYRRAAAPPVKILSKRRSAVGTTQEGVAGPSLEDRENRLRALTMSGGSRANTSGSVPATFVGSSDDEDEEDDADSIDDLFDEKPKPQSRPMASSPSSSRSFQAASSSSRPPIHSASRPRLLPSSSPSSAAPPRQAPKTKPSDIISSMISKPKPNPVPSKRSFTPPLPAASAFSRSPSPGHAEQKPMIIKKRPPPDIFNRSASKKARAR